VGNEEVRHQDIIWAYTHGSLPNPLRAWLRRNIDFHLFPLVIGGGERGKESGTRRRASGKKHAACLGMYLPYRMGLAA